MLDEVTRRELGPVLELADDLKRERARSVVRRVNAGDLVEALPRRRRRSTPTVDSAPGGPSGSRRPRRRAGTPSPPVTDDDDDQGDGEQVPGAPIHRLRLGLSRRPRRPRWRPSRCSRARGAASRRRSAGRSPARARRSAGRAARASGAGRRARSSARSASARPPLRSTRTTHSTISPPIASTAGSIARSEPPVVRMSSTRRTRSPGSIRKPRRNSRRSVPSSARTSSAKMLRTPSWRAVSKARMTPPVVGPATRSTSGSPSLPAAVRREEAAQLARRGRILEDLELLDVGVAVATALEQEVALAERAGAAEQRLGPLSATACRRAASSAGSNGGHSRSLRGLGDEGRRVDPADLGDLVEPAIRADRSR